MKGALIKILSRIILHSFSSGLLAALACFFYATFYYTLLFDFSEGSSKAVIFIAFFKNCLLAATLMSIIYYLLKGFLLKRGILADLLSGLLFSAATVALVFYVLKQLDPVFKNPELPAEYYNGFLMPMLFFPLLAWFTLKPLFLLKTASENK
jgi:hypothetical protein